jgi:hypothetical protein
VASVLASEYGIAPNELRGYAPSQIEALLEKVTTLSFRRDYMLAQLTAFVGNAMGGKGDGTGKKVDAAKLYSVTDFLPPWSRPEGFDSQGSNARVPKEAAREFLEASKRAQLPAWVIAVAPLAGIRSSAA